MPRTNRQNTALKAGYLDGMAGKPRNDRWGELQVWYDQNYREAMKSHHNVDVEVPEPAKPKSKKIDTLGHTVTFEKVSDAYNHPQIGGMQSATYMVLIDGQDVGALDAGAIAQGVNWEFLRKEQGQVLYRLRLGSFKEAKDAIRANVLRVLRGESF